MLTTALLTTATNHTTLEVERPVRHIFVVGAEGSNHHGVVQLLQALAAASFGARRTVTALPTAPLAAVPPVTRVEGSEPPIYIWWRSFPSTNKCFKIADR